MRRSSCFVWMLLILSSFLACHSLTLDEQKLLIQNGDLRFRALTPRAFVESWGKPPYVYVERTQFYTVANGNAIPRFRVPPGEPPPGWTAGVISDEAVFLGYPDHGEVLGFIEGRLVYREKLPADEVHTIGKIWQRESMFKTRLETGAQSVSKP